MIYYITTLIPKEGVALTGRKWFGYPQQSIILRKMCKNMVPVKVATTIFFHLLICEQLLMCDPKLNK